MDIRLTDLKNFIEIAACRTMSEGAEKLGITQPALSESMKRLEGDLREVLFYRSRTGIMLTPGGQEKLKQAKAALAALESMTGPNLKNDSRLLTIGCHPLLASYFLPKTFKQIQKENPSYHIRLRHDLSRVVQLEIQQGKVDIGIIVNAVRSPDLIVQHLADDEVCVWQSKHADAVTDKVFCNLALSQTQDILRKWKGKPANLVDIENLELIARFVHEGLGYGILPARAVSLLKFHNCERVPKTPSFQDKFYLVYRPEFGKHPMERLLIETLKRSVN